MRIVQKTLVITAGSPTETHRIPIGHPVAATWWTLHGDVSQVVHFGHIKTSIADTKVDVDVSTLKSSTGNDGAQMEILVSVMVP
ncbi:MAG: hypothetical protein AB7K09_18160 [Planctomycetota bacterium]